MKRWLALPVLLVAATPSFAFDDAAFCKMLTESLAEANATKGTVLDLITREDGMALSCDQKSVAYKRVITIGAAQMKPGWQAYEQQRYRKAMCKLEPWSSAIVSGWSVSMPVTTRDGQRFILTAKCQTT